MQIIKTALLGLVVYVSLWASGNSRIAIVGLKQNGVTSLEGAAAELSIRNAFVNSGKYSVLDRENMDKVLIERTIASDGLYDKDKASDIGRVLNVHHIMVGTLMKFQGSYLMELRVIDVESSSVVGSSTGKCNSSGELLKLGEYLVKKICNEEDVEVKDVMPIKKHTISSEEKSATVKVPKEASLSVDFKNAGLSLADYDNYKDSKMPITDWIASQRKSSMAASLIGFGTFTSGFFYTGDYGTGMLITLSKALGVIGMISNRKKGGVGYYVFAGITAAAITSDAVGVAVSVEKKNRRLDALIQNVPTLGYDSESKSLSLSYNRKF